MGRRDERKWAAVRKVLNTKNPASAAEAARLSEVPVSEATARKVAESENHQFRREPLPPLGEIRRMLSNSNVPDPEAVLAEIRGNPHGIDINYGTKNEKNAEMWVDYLQSGEPVEREHLLSAAEMLERTRVVLGETNVWTHRLDAAMGDALQQAGVAEEADALHDEIASITGARHDAHRRMRTGRPQEWVLATR